MFLAPALHRHSHAPQKELLERDLSLETACTGDRAYGQVASAEERYDSGEANFMNGFKRRLMKLRPEGSVNVATRAPRLKREIVYREVPFAGMGGNQCERFAEKRP